MKNLLVLAALAVIGCAAETPTAQQQTGTHHASENSCWLACGWPADISACLASAPSRRYAHNAASLSAAVNRMGGVPWSECVCAQFRVSRSGDLFDLSLRGTSPASVELVRRAFEETAPLSPVPDEAACVLDETLRMSFGGGRL